MPAAQHLADLTVRLGQSIPQILGTTNQRLGESVHQHQVDPQVVIGSHSGHLMASGYGRNSPGMRNATLVPMTPPPSRPHVELLTRDGCAICLRVHAQLAELSGELGFDLTTINVDSAASAGDPGLRAEFGDRLPVILLNGHEHSYWEVDEARLRADLARTDIW